MSHLSEESHYSESEEEDGSGSEGEEAEWTADHLKLLYLISQYAKTARTAEDSEGWIRKNQLIVLMYECIVAGCLDYDYAPCSMMIGTKRVWMNVTQEGKDDIDDLREGGLLNGLKLSSEDLQPITAYQVSMKGKDSRRRDCHFPDTPSPFLLKHLLKGEGGCSRMRVSPTARQGAVGTGAAGIQVRGG